MEHSSQVSNEPSQVGKRTEEKSWGEIIDFDGIAVHHGDFVTADSTEVVFVPESMHEGPAPA